ncbi:ras guanine nucleotide exchange factor domain-containing protein [Mycena leptocephala]|nr:ras guanine nucleotide exchange factor domain-containing protein [Mycena leptocephala]
MRNNSILTRKTRQKTAEKREGRAVANTWARYPTSVRIWIGHRARPAVSVSACDGTKRSFWADFRIYTVAVLGEVICGGKASRHPPGMAGRLRTRKLRVNGRLRRPVYGSTRTVPVPLEINPTSPMLAEKLWRPWTTSEKNPMSTGPEKIFQDVFLMTFLTFTTAELLHMLIAQYHKKCPLSLSSEGEEEWEQGTTLTITEKHSMMNTLTHFLLSIMEHLLMKTTHLIMVNVQGKEKIEPGMQEDSELVWPPSERPIDFEQECIPSPSQGKYLHAFCASYENTVTWIKMSILRRKRVGERAGIVNFWIKIAEKCRELAYFFSMGTVLTALSSSVIEGLKRTWLVAPSKSKSLLDSMRHFNDPVGGFSEYRRLVEDAEGPCVPFLAMYLTDIAHIASRYSDESGNISS